MFKTGRSGVFIVSFEHISHLFLVFLLLTLNEEMIAGLYKNQNILILENEYTMTTGFKPFIYGFSQTISKRRKFTAKVFVVLLYNASKIPQTLSLGLHYVLKAFPLDVN